MADAVFVKVATDEKWSEAIQLRGRFDGEKGVQRKYNPNHSPVNGRFTSRAGGSGVNVAGSDEEFAFLKDAEYKRVIDPTTGAEIDVDEGLVLLMENRGFYGKPTTLEHGAFEKTDKLSLDMQYGSEKSPTSVFYRGIQDDGFGVTVEKMSDSLVDGSSRFHGVGSYGNGLYFATEQRLAVRYAVGFQASEKGVGGMVQRVAIKPDAKFISESALTQEAFDLHRTMGVSFNNVKERGRLATWLGYDGIKATDRIVVLNHSKLILDKSSLVRLETKSLDLFETKMNPYHDQRGRFTTGIARGPYGDALAGSIDPHKKYPFDVRYPPASDDPAPGGRYEYHSTTASGLQRIAQEGLDPAKSQSGVTSVTPHLEGARFYGHIIENREQAWLLRVTRDNKIAKIKFPDGFDLDETREHWITSKVEPKDISVYLDGHWEWVNSIKKKHLDLFETKYNPNHDQRGRFAETLRVKGVKSLTFKYNPNHDRRGRFATSSGGRDLLGDDPSTVSEEWAQSLLDEMGADDERISRNGGDVALSRIVDEQWGGAGTVKVADLGNANDANLLFRGVEGSTDYHTGFINGDRFMGKGVYGNGIYFAQGGEFNVPGSALFQDNVGNAWYKAEGYGSNVRKYRISSSAKIVDWESLTAEHTAWLNKTEQGPVRSLTKDPGRYAALKGYDGIKSPPKKGVSQYVIFNRGVLEAHVDRQPDFSFNKSVTIKYNPNHSPTTGRFVSAHTFRDGAPSDDVKDLLAKTLDPLSDAEKNSLSAYTSTSYAGINRYAWMDPSKSEIFGGRPVDNLDIMYPSDYNLRHFTIMSGALEKTKTPVDLVVSHRMKAGERFFDSNGVPMDSSSVGKTLTNKGFTSTSLSKSVHLANTNWELEVPKGSKGAYVNPISSHKDEYEIILQRGAKFKITGFETDGLVTNIKARVVGFEPLESGAVLSERARKHNPYHDERGRFASARGYFSGGPVNSPAPLTKAETGRIGEEIAMKYLGDTASTLNVGRNNYPIDFVSHDRVVEVKTGLSTNPKASQQWRATIGQPGKKESEWLKTATAEEKRAWNNQKRQAILERKQRAVDEVSKKLGRPLKPTTLGVIIDPHTREAHVYEFEGFHLRIGWSDKGVKEAYRASYKL